MTYTREDHDDAIELIYDLMSRSVKEFKRCDDVDVVAWCKPDAINQYFEMPHRAEE